MKLHLLAIAALTSQIAILSTTGVSQSPSQAAKLEEGLVGMWRYGPAKPKEYKGKNGSTWDVAVIFWAQPTGTWTTMNPEFRGRWARKDSTVILSWDGASGKGSGNPPPLTLSADHTKMTGEKDGESQTLTLMRRAEGVPAFLIKKVALLSGVWKWPGDKHGNPDGGFVIFFDNGVLQSYSARETGRWALNGKTLLISSQTHHHDDSWRMTISDDGKRLLASLPGKDDRQIQMVYAKLGTEADVQSILPLPRG